MKSKLIETMKLNGYTDTSTDGSMTRVLNPAINDFSLGFLIGKAGRDNIISIQWGIVNHAMWELQQDVENIKSVKIQFLLFSDIVHTGVAASASEQSLEFQSVSSSLKNCIEFMGNQQEMIINDVANSLKTLASPTVFSYENDLLNIGMAHYFGLLYQHVNTGISVEEIDTNISKLINAGMNRIAPPIFKLGLLRSYVGN